MRLVSTIYEPSSVLSSFKCRLSKGRETEHLVVARLDRLDVYEIMSTGAAGDSLRRICGTQIWGKVVKVVQVPIIEEKHSSASAEEEEEEEEEVKYSNILVLIDHPDPELIFLTLKRTEVLEEEEPRHEDGEDMGDDPVQPHPQKRREVYELEVKKELQLFERSPRQMDYMNTVLVDPKGEFAVVCCYTGKLKIVQLENGGYESDFDVTLPELNILSLALLSPKKESPVLAILHVDYQRRIQLLTRDLNIEEYELSPFPSTLIAPTIIPSKWLSLPCTDALPHLIPIESIDNCEDGIIVLGGKKILYYPVLDKEERENANMKRKKIEHRKAGKDKLAAEKAREKEKKAGEKRRKAGAMVDWPYCEIQSWCYAGSSSRFLIGDAFGKLAMLSMDSFRTLGLVLLTLGETSPATTLTYLTSQVLYVGSHFGNSQLIHISPTAVDANPILIPKDIPSIKISEIAKPPPNHKGKHKAAPEDEDVEMGSPEEEDAVPVDSSLGGYVVQGEGSHLTPIPSSSDSGPSSISPSSYAFPKQNIAPIVDAILIDPDDSGQKQIVTCSGGYGSGAVNVLRRGADFAENARLEGLEGVVRVWSLRPRSEDVTDTHLVVTTPLETHVFRLTGSADKLQYVNPPLSGRGFVTNEATIALSSQPLQAYDLKKAYESSKCIVQVTASGVYLLKYDETIQEFLMCEGMEWKPSHGTSILAACINPSQVYLGISRQRLALLSLAVDGRWIAFEHNISRKDPETNEYLTNEISSISAHLLTKGKFSAIIAVSYWVTQDIEIFRVADRKFISLYISKKLDYLPRSLVLSNFGTGRNAKSDDYWPRLVVGCADGSVLEYRVEHKTGVTALAQGSAVKIEPGTMIEKAANAVTVQLLDRRTVAFLGHAPVSLTLCELENAVQGNAKQSVVVATGSRAAFLFWDKRRLRSSQVLVKDAVTATNINSEAYPNSVVVATTTAISVGKVGKLDRMHIRPFLMGHDSPSKITHDPSSRTLAVACVRRQPFRIGDDEMPNENKLKVLDDTSYREIASHTFPASSQERISALQCLPLTVGGVAPPHLTSRDDTKEGPIAAAQGTYFICVGTMINVPNETEPSHGRLLVFQVRDVNEGLAGVQLSLVAETEVKGVVYAIACAAGMIAITVNSSVIVFRLVYEDSKYTLRKETARKHNYFATSLVSSNDDTLVLGDSLASVSVLKLVKKQRKGKGRGQVVTARANPVKREGSSQLPDSKDDVVEQEWYELEVLARDYGPLWPSALGAVPGRELGAGGILGGDASLNLFTFTLGGTLASPTLEKDGNYHIADFVTKFIKGGLSSNPGTELSNASASNAPRLEASHVFFTSSGRIGLIVDIKDKELGLELTALERNLGYVINGVGGVSHARFRAPRIRAGGQIKEEASCGFLDGDYLEQFASLTDEEKIEKVMNGRNEAEKLTMTREDLVKVLEMLRSLH